MTIQPTLFVSHGAPTFATDPGLAGAQLRGLGEVLQKPRAIVVISPHWMTRGVVVSAAEQPETIHDFGGFPQALYRLQYPAPGSPRLAERVQDLLTAQGIPARLDLHRGLDHGAWVPLMHLYPDADVPVIQVSLPMDADEAKSFALGQALSALREEGVLIVGSGSLTHNLYEFRMGHADSASYAQEFTDWVRSAVQSGDAARLLRTLTDAPHAARAHPTTEHFLPLLVALGAAGSVLPATVLDGGIQHGVLAMESYLFGQSVTVDAKEPDHA